MLSPARRPAPGKRRARARALPRRLRAPPPAPRPGRPRPAPAGGGGGAGSGRPDVGSAGRPASLVPPAVRGLPRRGDPRPQHLLPRRTGLLRHPAPPPARPPVSAGRARTGRRGAPAAARGRCWQRSGDAEAWASGRWDPLSGGLGLPVPSSYHGGLAGVWRGWRRRGLQAGWQGSSLSMGMRG